MSSDSQPFDPLPNYPLRALSTLRVGGPAEFFSAPSTFEALQHALHWAENRKLPTTFLGGGSNVVIHDQGIAGLVLQPMLTEESWEIHGDKALVRVGAGVNWDSWVAGCVEKDWAGVECLSGIPGSVGATPIQNVGAYGKEVAESIESVDVYDRKSRTRISLPASSCEFSYRTSLFKSGCPGRYIVLGVCFRLDRKAPAPVRNGELARALNECSARPTLRQVRETVLAVRRKKSMVLDPQDPNSRSCGSFFLNPVVNRATLRKIESVAQQDVPHYPQSAPSTFKIPAAWLIERAGFRKGQRLGKAGISSRHALALICHSGASATDIVSAARQIRDGVATHFSVALRPEPQWLGFEVGPDGLPPT